MPYKVVTQGRRSLLELMLGSDISLDYIKNKWTEPHLRDSSIFVFENLSYARMWLSGLTFNRAVEIWSCDCIGLHKLQVRVNHPNYYDVRHFWSGAGSLTAESPLGSMGYRAVKLIQFIEVFRS